MNLTPRTKLINMRVSEEFKAAAEDAAKADRRSLTGLIEKLVLDHIEARAQAAPKAAKRKAKG